MANVLELAMQHSIIENLRDRVRGFRWHWTDDGRLRAVIIGKPGDSVPFRHRFKFKVAARTLELHGRNRDSDPGLYWREKAQLLEISNLRFADGLTAAAAARLSEEEAAHCRENNLSAIVITVTINK